MKRIGLLFVCGGLLAGQAHLNAANSAINLIPLIEPGKDAVVGQWTVQNGVLACDNSGRDLIGIPYTVPEEYDFRITFTPIDHRDVRVSQVLSKSGHQFVFVMGHERGGGTAFGFGLIEGKDYDKNRSTVIQSRLKLKRGVTYESTVQVRKDGLKAIFNGELVTQWKTDYSDMDYTGGKLRHESLLGVGSYKCAVQFQSIDVIEISGKGQLAQRTTVASNVAKVRPVVAALPQPVAQPEARAAQSPRAVLSREAVNASRWALAGLDEAVPADIRENLTYLREDLLDEGKSATQQVSTASYKCGWELCIALTAALDERDQARVRAGYRDAQAQAATKITSANLEATRTATKLRAFTSGDWPQYERERDQRTEIARQQNNQVTLAKQVVLTEWATRAATLRRGLDESYRRYREALRQDPSYK